MNWIMVAAGVLMFGAASWESSGGNFKLAIIYGCYSIANFTLATLK